jgi:hypothetical protein
MTKRYLAEKRGEFHFAVLGSNPDAGKPGVCYSGDYFTICTTDGPDEAKRIARALNMLAAVERVGQAEMKE